ncbi:MAG: hypothetical protein AB8E87_14435 [Prochlorococcus sp.]
MAAKITARYQSSLKQTHSGAFERGEALVGGLWFWVLLMKRSH